MVRTVKSPSWQDKNPCSFQNCPPYPQGNTNADMFNEVQKFGSTQGGCERLCETDD